jgi:hypothetical protein
VGLLKPSLTSDDSERGSRSLYVSHVADLSAWDTVFAADPGLSVNAVFIATEEKPKLESVQGLATNLITHGVFQMSAWGQGCEFVHDVWDEEDVWLDVQRQERGEPSLDSYVNTTWHNDESLQEALEFFWKFAFPMTGKTWGPTYLALAVGSEALARQLDEAVVALQVPLSGAPSVDG